MAAQPIFDPPGPDDPAEILRTLPADYRAAFLADYAQALEAARRPEQYREIASLAGVAAPGRCVLRSHLR